MTAVPNVGRRGLGLRALLLLANAVSRPFTLPDRPPQSPRPPRRRQGPSYYETGLMGRERFRL